MLTNTQIRTWFASFELTFGAKAAKRLVRLPKQPPEYLFHGTATRFLDSILAEGLRPGSRHEVHLSTDVSTAISVGQRHGKAVVLRVDALRMHQQGFAFFQAENGVWLSERVPSAFLELHFD
jgi:putative RNA 2'-phosphotransferase